MVVVGIEADLVGVERLGAIDVRDGDLHQLEPPFHDERQPIGSGCAQAGQMNVS